MPVRRLGAVHDSGETEYRISNFGYPVSCAHAHAQIPWIPEPSTVNNKLKRRVGSTGRFFD
jgi:hypothetical protein